MILYFVNFCCSLRSTYIDICVLDNFLSYTAIVLNIVTIQVIRKTSSLPTILKTLILLLVSLAVSDFGVLGQPLYISFLVKWLQQSNAGCSIRLAFAITLSMFSLASFLSVVASSVERFLAILLHLRHQDLLTQKRVVAVAISIWIFNFFFL